jgi:hypothetical protein
VPDAEGDHAAAPDGVIQFPQMDDYNNVEKPERWQKENGPQVKDRPKQG